MVEQLGIYVPLGIELTRLRNFLSINHKSSDHRIDIVETQFPLRLSSTKIKFVIFFLGTSFGC